MRARYVTQHYARWPSCVCFLGVCVQSPSNTVCWFIDPLTQPMLDLVALPEHGGSVPYMHPPVRPWAPAPMPGAPRVRPAAMLPTAGPMDTALDPRTQLAVPAALVGIPQLQAMPPLNLPLTATAPTDPRAVPMAPAEGGTMLNIDPVDLAAILTNVQAQQAAAPTESAANAGEDVGGQLLSLLDGLKD